MTFDQMMYFSTVCQTSDLSQAARQLHISRLALLTALSQIETACGTTLFQICNDAIELTDEGAILLQKVEPILRQYTQLEALIVNRELKRNELRIGVSPILASGILSELAAAFRQKNPEIQIKLIEAETEQLYHDLDDGKVDLILSAPKRDTSEEKSSMTEHYEALRLLDMQLVFAVCKDHLLAERDSVTWSDLILEPLILTDLSSDIGNDTEALFKRNGYHLPDDTCVVKQLYTSLLLIEAGTAAGILPADALRHHPQVKGLRIPGAEGPSAYLIYRKDQHLFRAAKAFLDTAKGWLDNNTADAAHCN